MNLLQLVSWLVLANPTGDGAVASSTPAGPTTTVEPQAHGAPEQPDAQRAGPSRASEPKPANIVFLEALGSGLFYSVNYERRIEAYHLGLRAGASFATIPVNKYGSSGNLAIATMPILANYYIEFGYHNVQLGLGTTLMYTSVSQDTTGTSFGGERAGLGLAAAGVVGYRYLPPNGGFSFGVAFTPLLRTSKFLPWGGANLGYVF